MMKCPIAAIALLSCASGQLHAQENDCGIVPTRSVWSGVDSATQASRGEYWYLEDECGRCHGDALDGDSGYPALAGSDFMTTWEGQSALDLMGKIHSMPIGRPDDIGIVEATELIAFILRENKIPEGSSDLPMDLRALAGIRIDSQKPDAK